MRYKKENKIRKMKQRQKMYEKSNPSLAKRIEGQIAAVRGRQTINY